MPYRRGKDCSINQIISFLSYFLSEHLKEDEIEGFLERIVTPIGTSAKADVPRRYLKRRVYVIITKKKVRK